MAASPARHRLQLTCPECGHTQSEPALAVSCVCRGCGGHFKVENGKVVARPKPSATFTAGRRSPAETEPETALEAPKPTTPFLRRPEPVPTPPVHPLLRWFIRPPQPREVLCDCGRKHFAAPTAQSAQCPGCGAYISLRDYEIADRWNSRIHTRGNVIIAKGGALSGVPVVCHNLTSFGELSASVECSGELTLHGRGRIPGNIRCRTLVVGRGAKIEFLHAVYVEEVILRGHVTGHIHCTGTVTLEKRAVLDGLLQAARLVMKKGARHQGSMEILGPEDTAGPA